MGQYFRCTLIGALALVAAERPVAANTLTSFPAGSLIIPGGAAFQSDCGASSMYGLLFTVLRANQWLRAHDRPPITIHWAYSDTKGSPNRCVPTNLHTAPTASPRWNDGCDFSVTNSGAAPVTLVTNASPAAANDTNVVTINTATNPNVHPGYPARTIQHTTSASTNVTTVSYLGGPFIIHADDAQLFLNLLAGASGYTSMTDDNGVAISFAAYRTSGTCAFGASSQNHYVRIHRASAAFSAPDNVAMNDLPPRLALLDTGTGVSGGILPQYLMIAGLDFPGAQGCPAGGVNAGNAARCPRGGTPGTIYDVFDVADLAANRITQTTAAGKPKYKTIWTPHWDMGAALSSTQTSALDNIGAFVQDATHGLMAECASIGHFEGAVDTTNTLRHAATTQGALQTCLEGSPGTCATAQPAPARGLVKNLGSPGGNYRNCTDPGLANGVACVYYPSPGDPFVQIGDWDWIYRGGLIENFAPNPRVQKTIYRPSVHPMIGNVPALDSATLATNPLALVQSWNGSHGPLRGDAAKGNVYYLAGHSYAGGFDDAGGGEVAGVRVVLNTMLSLDVIAATSATTNEVARSSPVIATISGTSAIVQGTFENVQPAPAPAVLNVASDAAGFTFPATLGHLRAIALGNATPTATSFGATTAIFDAADGIPPPRDSGCTYFTGACRTVFTTVQAATDGVSAHPPNVYFASGSASVLGPLLAPNLTATEWTTLVQRVLAGAPNGSGGYTAKLGGIDRSTAAVIPSSTVAGGARPTMIYVGATDGMLHAICASVQAPCDALGRELWAYVPRQLLGSLRANAARIDGSPRVVDLYGDFYGTGRRELRTILMFPIGSAAAVHALDITDPASPQVLWEYAMPSATARGAFELGQGLSLAAGRVAIGGAIKNVAFAQTNNLGTAGAGTVVVALDIETGALVWKTGFAYPAPRTAGNPSVPASGIPGGAVAVDKRGANTITDLVIGTLYGDVYELDPATGENRHGATPLFRFRTDLHPIGTAPAIFSDGRHQYAVVTSGGYADASASTWSGSATQYVVAIDLDTPSEDAPLDEASGAPGIRIAYPLGPNERGYAQALVVGNQLFFTSDTANVNASAYGTGTGGPTGHAYRIDLAAPTSATTVVVAGGASSIASSWTNLYTGASSALQQLSNAQSATGPSVDSSIAAKVSRELWLRSR